MSARASLLTACLLVVLAVVFGSALRGAALPSGSEGPELGPAVSVKLSTSNPGSSTHPGRDSRTASGAPETTSSPEQPATHSATPEADPVGARPVPRHAPVLAGDDEDSDEDSDDDVYDSDDDWDDWDDDLDSERDD